jgi:hypothetical protein
MGLRSGQDAMVKRKKFLSLLGIEPAHSLVAILTELPLQNKVL